MTPLHSIEANAIARWSICQALWPLGILTVLGSLAVHVGAAPEPIDWFRWFVLALAVAASLVVIGYSTILGLDALLFRIIARYEDEWKGGAAVDDILARMNLKAVPQNTRSLASRVAGTRRLARRQRVATAVAASSLLLLMAPV